MIVSDRLSKRYGSVQAVRSLSLTVDAGEIYGFLGPNGAGKTTTIKMLTGLLRPTEGSARVGGFDLESQPVQAKRLIGFVPDNPFLYEKLTGREYLRLTGDLWGVDGEGREERIAALLEEFELTEKADSIIQSYSRGMRQKTALAAALLHSPKALFLDEPTVGLDPKGARLLKDTLLKLADAGAAVFISTHILEIAEQLCDRVGIVRDGELIAEGEPRELLTNSNNASLEELFLELTESAMALELAE
ncbi:MAG: ABC transporter ATP-binding protein [Armatimonadetes bacterium]|nr:ABC transporter ATP-binding protein [Armatimonadota bacterium]